MEDFLKERKLNKIYVKLCSERKIDKSSLSETLTSFYKTFFVKSEEKRFDEIKTKLKSKFSSSYSKSIFDKMENIPIKNYGLHKSFGTFKSFQKPEKLPFIYETLEQESNQWCLKLREWDSEAKNKIKDNRKNGLSLIDYLVFLDRREGKIVI